MVWGFQIHPPVSLSSAHAPSTRVRAVRHGPQQRTQSAGARRRRAERGHGGPRPPWAQPPVPTMSPWDSQGPPVGSRRCRRTRRNREDERGAGVFSGEAGTAGEEGDRRLEKSLLGTRASYKYRRARERSADTSRAPSSLTRRSLRVSLQEKGRTVSLHPACSLRGCVPFRIMPCHPPLSTEGVETREASDGPRRRLPDLPAAGLRATPAARRTSAPPASLGARLHKAVPPASGRLCITAAWVLCLSLRLLRRESAVPSLGAHLW